MHGSNAVAVRPAAPAVPSTAHASSKRALGHENAVAPLTPTAQSESDRFIFVLRPSSPLPVIELARTPARDLFSQTTHRAVLRFVRRHFNAFVWYFRFGISCFVALLFVEDGLVRDVILAVMIPAHQSLIATTFFLSRDVVGLLLHNYDFYFATIINSLNWIAFAVVLGDKRVLASMLGWFGMQIVITVDASYRTFSTAVATMRLGVPIVLVMFGFVSLRSIDGAHFFTVSIDGHRIYDAADIMGFTSFTLAILLAKIAILKKRRVVSPTRGVGYYRIPCALIKITLRLDQAACATGGSGSGALASCSTNAAQILPAPQGPASQRSTFQRMKLSPLKVTHIDARRTLLPLVKWAKLRPFAVRNQSILRLGFYGIGALGYGSLVVQNVRILHSQVGLESIPADVKTIQGECAAALRATTDHVLSLVAHFASAFFCGVFVLFYQRDLLKLLWTNFDYIFSIAQIATYQFCVLDMACWEPVASLSSVTWSMWLAWALTIDTLTPLVKKSIFGLPRKLPAIILASVLLSGLGTTYIVIFIEHNGFRDRTILNFTISSTHSFALTTKSILLGRAATISLWCTRQVVALATRRDDELHLIRGLVEYESPFGLFPPKLNKHSPALPDDV